jgi:hypothetical protein
MASHHLSFVLIQDPSWRIIEVTQTRRLSPEMSLAVMIQTIFDELAPGFERMDRFFANVTIAQ